MYKFRAPCMMNRCGRQHHPHHISKESAMASVIAGFSQELAEATEKVGPSVVTVHARHRVPSSGIHWRSGIVVTANHSVRSIDDITILIHGGKRLAAKLTGRDSATDLALLKFDPEAA